MANKKQKIEMIDVDKVKDKLVIVRIGTEALPATEADIKDALKNLKYALKGTKCRLIVTHHAFKIEVV